MDGPGAGVGRRVSPGGMRKRKADRLWMQPQVIGRAKEDGRIPDAEDVRLWNLISLRLWREGNLVLPVAPSARRAAVWGVRAVCDGRFGDSAVRDGGPDCAVGEQSCGSLEIKSRQGRRGNCVCSRIGAVQLYAGKGVTAFYNQSICGAHIRPSFDSNIQSDFVSIDDIGDYKVIYLPYPVMLKEDTAGKLKKFVEQGGVLISEGLPGYFGDHGHVGTVQPNYGLNEVFGARENYVEFMPDIREQMMLEVKDLKIYGRYFRQDYDLQGGTAAGHYEDGKLAAVEHQFGKGRTHSAWALFRGSWVLAASCSEHKGTVWEAGGVGRGDSNNQGE